MTQRIGQQLGNYRLHRLLGHGGFADVYMGYHRYLQTPAAIKVLHQPLSRRSTQAFLLEAQTVARLIHPHIIRVLDFGVEGNNPFLVLDYAPYGSLRQRYRSGSLVPLEEIVPVVQQVAQALQYAHLAGRIHQDIKPENLLLGRHQQVWLSDFGFAITIPPTAPLVTLGLGGTMAYAAPEQLDGYPVPASDQYALGVVVYEWLSGQTPFVGPALELVLQHLLTPPPPLRQHLPTLPSAVERVVFTALNKDPEQRFPSVAAFAAALSRASEPSPSSHRAPAVRASTALRADPLAGSAHFSRGLSPQDRRPLQSAAPAVSDRRTTSESAAAPAHTSSPSPLPPLRHVQQPLTWRGRADAGSQQETAFRKLPLPVSPGAIPPRWTARERLVGGLLLLIVLCVGTLSASLVLGRPATGRTPGSSARANGAAVSPALTPNPTPSPSAPAGPAAMPTSAPSPSFPILRFGVTPSRFVDSCGTHKTALPPKTVLLDNTGSTVPVTWRVQITTTEQTGHLWATANPASGSIPAGQDTALRLLPLSKLCQHTKGSVTYRALLTYQGADLEGTISITDLVIGP